MKTYKIANTDLEVSRIGYGCMEIGGQWNRAPLTAQVKQDAIKSVRAALDQGINFFDHADIYTYGKSEEVFSQMWDEVPGLREKIVLQSKAGIWFPGDPQPDSPARYDFSYEHIMSVVNGSLQRLKTDYLDILLLHRPDPLVEPEEVAQAFDELQQSGKVRYFGVSNHTPAQIELLQRWVDQPFVVNQLELSLLHLHLINAGVVMNQDDPPWPVRNEDTMEYCRLHDITIQAWSPLARGRVTGAKVDKPDKRIEETAKLVAALAEEKQVSREAIVIAWLLRHPAKIQPIIGTKNAGRIQAACEGDTVELSREAWYQLFAAGRGSRVP